MDDVEVLKKQLRKQHEYLRTVADRLKLLTEEIAIIADYLKEKSAKK